MNKRMSHGFLAGVGAGVLAAAVGAMTMGAGQRVAGDQFVTSSADGRNAYLWSASGGSLTFVASAEAPKGNGGDHGKPEDKGGKPDDKDGKPEDGAKGKGKGKGGG